MKLTTERAIVLVIVCLGLFLRVYDLGGESLWNDEARSIKLSHMSCSGIIKNRAHNVHPPLYFLLLRYWVILFGDSEVAARSMSVLFGFGAIFIMYEVGKVTFDREVGIFASLILALSTFHIRYSQEVRGYTLMALLTLLSIYFFVRLFKERNLWISICYIFSTALLIYTHYFGFFVLIAENIYSGATFLLSQKDSKLHFKKWIFLQFSVFLFYAPWVRILLKQILTVEKKGGFSSIAPLAIYKISETLQWYSGSKALMILFVILAVLSLITSERARESRPRDCLSFSSPYPRQEVAFTDATRIYLLLLWLFTPIILPFLASHFSPRIYAHRYTISASLAFYLLGAKGIRNLPFKPAKWAITILITGLSLVSAWKYFEEVQKEQWRTATHYVETIAEREDLILFNAPFVQKAYRYYSKRTDLIKKPFPSKTVYVDRDNIKKLASTVRGHDRVWLILSHTTDKEGLIAEALRKSYELSHHQAFFGIEVYLFQKPLKNKSLQPSG